MIRNIIIGAAKAAMFIALCFAAVELITGVTDPLNARTVVLFVFIVWYFIDREEGKRR